MRPASWPTLTTSAVYLRGRTLFPGRQSSAHRIRCCAQVCSWRDALFAEGHRELHRFDDFHITGAAADIAAERLENFRLTRIRIFPQQSGRSHDETGRAIATL